MKGDCSEGRPELSVFSGRPRDFLRISTVLGTGISAYLFCGMVVIEYLLRGETWIFGWRPAAGAILFAAFFSRLSYRWMMDLDGQLGRGSRWALPEHLVRLPERHARRGKLSSRDTQE